MTDSKRPRVLITGCSGLIGSRLVKRLKDDYAITGFDVKPSEEEPAPVIDWVKCDLTDDQSVSDAVNETRDRYGNHLASVIHLAAYYDFSGELSPLYQELTVEGTRRLLKNLQPMHVEQFVFSSTLLVMDSADEGTPITESAEVDAEWAYPQSKLKTEKVIREEQGDIPAAILRIAGVYDEDCHSLPISQHISRIYEKRLESYFFPGNTSHGQAFVHLDDLADCFYRVVERRHELDHYEMLLIAEDDVMSYSELQDALGRYIHGKKWTTLRIPKPLAKAGAWVKENMASDEADEPFIKPWMVDLADQNYPVVIEKARRRLGWNPTRTLRQTLPEMIGRLHHDPIRWYEINDLPVPDKVSS